MTKKQAEKKEKDNSWLNDKSVKFWLDNVASKGTRKNHVMSFPKFLDFVKKTPKELLEERKKDLQSDDPEVKTRYERLLIEYFNHLKLRMKHNSAIFYLSAPRSFFAAHMYPITFTKLQLKLIAPEDSDANAYFPSNEDVRAMYSIAGVRERALLLLLYQSGMSETDVSNLDIEKKTSEKEKRTPINLYDKDGKFIDTSQHLPFNYHRVKTGELAQTCISNEALNDIRAYLQSRGFPKAGPLFLGSKNMRLEARYIGNAIQELADKSLGAFAEKFQPKSLRVSYINALEESNIHKNFSERMAGHDIGVSASYTRMQILETYGKVFSRLTINHARQEREATQLIGKQLLDLTTKLEKLEHYVTEVVPRYAPELEFRDEAIDSIHKKLPNAQVEDVFFTVQHGQKATVIDISGYLDENGQFKEYVNKIIKPKTV
jgi:site-specific recombinase XerD